MIEKHKFQRMKILTPGMRFMLLGTFFFSIGSLFIKMTGTRIPPMEMLWIRGVIGVGMCWVMLRKSGVGKLGTRKFMLALRGLFGFGAMFCDFYAVVHLPLADALVLLFFHPVAVAVLAWLVMGEKLSKAGLFSIVMSIIGVTIVCRPSFLFGVGSMDLDTMGVIVAFISIGLTSIAILTVRTLAKTEPTAVVMLYPPVVIALLSPFFAHGWVMPNATEILPLLSIGIFMNLGQFFMTKGFAIESAARISGVSCLEIVFAAFWGMVFLGEIPDLWTVGGGGLIVLGVFVLGRSGVREQEA